MKLRNKKTGEIAVIRETIHLTKENDICCGMGSYNSLAELNEEWEDYEGPVGYWYVTEQGIPGRINFDWDTKESIENHKEIGNYFETYKEAERAVEKLKAWKRLKDKGFRFEKWQNVRAGESVSPIWFYFEKDTKLEDVNGELNLLFGGEDGE